MKAIKKMSLLALFALVISCDNTATTTTTTENNLENTTDVVLDKMSTLSPDSTRKLEYEINKVTGAKHGNYKEFSVASNALLIERNYKENKLDGLEKIYFPTGQVEATMTYKDGVHHGEFNYYYEDGKVRQKGNYVDGKMEGMLVAYYNNGNLKEEVMHVAGLTQGAFKEYNENGTISAEGEFTSKSDTEELEQGLFKEYDGEGTLTKKMLCKEGQCCTIWTLKDGDVKSKNKICDAIIAEMQKKES